jgi:hypothetical protein
VRIILWAWAGSKEFTRQSDVLSLSSIQDSPFQRRAGEKEQLMKRGAKRGIFLLETQKVTAVNSIYRKHILIHRQWNSSKSHN